MAHLTKRTRARVFGEFMESYYAGHSVLYMSFMANHNSFSWFIAFINDRIQVSFPSISVGRVKMVSRAGSDLPRVRS